MNARRLAAIGLVLVAVALLALTAVVTFGFAEEYDAGLGGVLQTAFGSLVPGALALGCLLGARDLLRAARPSTPAAAASVLLLAVLLGAAGTGLGAEAHDRRKERIATACSQEDRALLQALELPGLRTGPFGDESGRCELLLSLSKPADAAFADTADALEREGWRSADREEGRSAFERGSERLLVSVVSDPKASEVRVSLR